MKPQELPELQLDDVQMKQLVTAFFETHLALLAAVRREAESHDPDAAERARTFSKALEVIVDWRHGWYGFPQDVFPHEDSGLGKEA